MTNNSAELIIVFTSSGSGGTQTETLLNKTGESHNGNGGCDFGNNFFPIIAVNESGGITCLFEQDFSTGKNTDCHLLYIVPDSIKLEDDFLNHIKESCTSLIRLFVLLHKSSNHITDQRTKILDLIMSKSCKTAIAECHHTTSESANPKHALGDGLELVAASVTGGNVNLVDLQAGIKYLKTKPAYCFPEKESLIYLYKALSLMPLKLKNSGDKSIFSEKIKNLKNVKEIKLVEKQIDTIKFIAYETDYFAQLEKIEKLIIDF